MSDDAARPPAEPVAEASSAGAASGAPDAKVSPRGVTGSLRSWKAVQPKQVVTRFSALVVRKSGAKGSAFNAQQVHRMAAQRAKATAQRLRELKEAEEKEAKEKRDDRKRRRAENELKSASYQVLSDPTKLKKMSKKQLRTIKKTRLNPATGVVEIVGAYS